MTLTAVLKINEELNGIELYFNTKPDQNILTNLKTNGFRWSNFKKCWYTKQSENALHIANSITNNAEVLTLPTKETTKKAAAKKTIGLWDATQWTEMEVNTKQDTKGMAKEIRSHVKARFPKCKFSVTSDYSRINFYIVSSPYEKDSKYLEAIHEYCKQLVNAYKYCTNYDPYGDYGSSYNFYSYISVDYNYIQTEATEEIKNDMIVFDSKLAEAEKAKQEKEEKAFQEYQKERELQEIQYKKRQEEEKKQIDNIYNSIDIKTLDEINQYFVTGSEFADLNKNNTLDQYKEEVKKGEYTLQDVKITKEIHFNNKEALTNFSNMLLNDFDFLTNTGGSYSDDNRINSMTDFYNMDEEERNTVKWNLLGVAIYLNNKLQFVVDAQGYSYARYVGLTDNATVEKSITVDQILNQEEIAELKLKADQLEDISTSVIDELGIIETWQNENWKEYKEVIKSKLSKYEFKLTKRIIQQLEIEQLKVTMYKLLQEVDGIQDQFKNADIQQGEKVTMFYISDWGSIVTNRMTFESVENSTYAQYDNAVKITFTPDNKRKLHYKYFYSTLLVYRGWHELQDNVLNHVEEKNGIRTTRSKYHSCDKKQYDEILNYFEQQGIKAVVNTYKPTF